MEPEASLPWLALTMTPGIAARLSARLLREFGTPQGVFKASLAALESCNLPAPVALYVLLAATGLRISEALALEARHFINGGLTIKVEQQVDKDCPRTEKQLLLTPRMVKILVVHA